MNTKTRNKGFSSVMAAAIFAIGLILLITFIAISIPLAKSYADKTQWVGQMSNYKPPNPINATNGQPAFDGYCLVNTVNNETYAACPSTNPTTT